MLLIFFQFTVIIISNTFLSDLIKNVCDRNELNSQLMPLWIAFTNQISEELKVSYLKQIKNKKLVTLFGSILISLRTNMSK